MGCGSIPAVCIRWENAWKDTRGKRMLGKLRSAEMYAVPPVMEVVIV